MPAIRRISNSEVLIEMPRSSAKECVVSALQRLGNVTGEGVNGDYVEGRIRFGLNAVKIRASLVERVAGQTTVVIQGSSNEVWGIAARNASNRLIQLLVNSDNLGFKIDRSGISPVVLGVIVVLFVVLVAIIVSLLHP